MSQQHEIVILGANFAGTGVAHYLLRHTIPALTALDGSKSYHISLVGPADKTYFKIAIPRVVADPSKISFDQVAYPISQSFAKYAKENNYTFVQGLATGLDAEAKTVTITAADGTSKSLPYNTLVIATGTKSDALWTVNDDLSATKASLDALHAALPNAKTVTIGGGGAVGVETAGELISKYPKLKITLLSGTTRLLPRLSTKTSAKAENMLKSKGVTVVHNRRVTSAIETTATPITVEYDDKSSAQTDIYINAVGGAPNTHFLPSSWLDERKKVKVDYDSCRTDIPGVYATGDVASNSNSSVMDYYNQWPATVSAIGRDLAAGIGQTNPTGAAFKEKKYKQLKDSQFVPIGPSGGVAQIMGWGVPSFFVWLIKARTFFIEKARPMADGDDYQKA